MKNSIATLLLLLLINFSHAQINAITDTGDEVILYDDGTWAYINDSSSTKPVELTMNPNEFTKKEAASFLVKSKRVNIGIHINPKKWKFSKNEDGDVQEFSFNSKREDIYGMLVSEKTEIPVESLRNIALQNAREAAPDVKMIKEEYRMVNGNKVIMMQLGGTIQGIKFIYFGYYFSNEKGSIQLVSYTARNLFEEYKLEMEDFLNGLVVLE